MLESAGVSLSLPSESAVGPALVPVQSKEFHLGVEEQLHCHRLRADTYLVQRGLKLFPAVATQQEVMTAPA